MNNRKTFISRNDVYTIRFLLGLAFFALSLTGCITGSMSSVGKIPEYYYIPVSSGPPSNEFTTPQDTLRYPCMETISSTLSEITNHALKGKTIQFLVDANIKMIYDPDNRSIHERSYYTTNSNFALLGALSNELQNDYIFNMNDSLITTYNHSKHTESQETFKEREASNGILLKKSISDSTIFSILSRKPQDISKTDIGDYIIVHSSPFYVTEVDSILGNGQKFRTVYMHSNLDVEQVVAYTKKIENGSSVKWHNPIIMQTQFKMRVELKYVDDEKIQGWLDDYKQLFNIGYLGDNAFIDQAQNFSEENLIDKLKPLAIESECFYDEYLYSEEAYFDAVAIYSPCFHEFIDSLKQYVSEQSDVIYQITFRKSRNSKIKYITKMTEDDVIALYSKNQSISALNTRVSPKKFHNSSLSTRIRLSELGFSSRRELIPIPADYKRVEE